MFRQLNVHQFDVPVPYLIDHCNVILYTTKRGDHVCALIVV